MAIGLEIDESRSLMIWTYFPGRQTAEEFRDHFAALTEIGEVARACRYLMIVYSRGVDVSDMDAEAMDRMQARLVRDRSALFGEDGIEQTVFVCPDALNKLAIEHFIHRSDEQPLGEYSIFETRQEAETWLFADERSAQNG